MPPGDEGVPLLHRHAAARDVGVEELADHGDGLGAGHHLGLRMGAEHRSQGGAVVRLHVVDDHVIQGTAPEDVLQVLVKVGAHGGIRRVQQDGFLVLHEVGVVADAPGHGEHVLKEAQPPVGPADQKDIRRNRTYIIHNGISFTGSDCKANLTQFPRFVEGFAPPPVPAVKGGPP